MKFTEETVKNLSERYEELEHNNLTSLVCEYILSKWNDIAYAYDKYKIIRDVACNNPSYFNTPFTRMSAGKTRLLYHTHKIEIDELVEELDEQERKSLFEQCDPSDPLAFDTHNQLILLRFAFVRTSQKVGRIFGMRDFGNVQYQ